MKKNCCKFILIISALVTHCFSMGIIKQEHSQRQSEFCSNRNGASILGHTQEIYKVLSDENKVSKKRSASDSEKKTIFQAIMASSIIHGGIESNGQKAISAFTYSVTDKKLSSHYQVISLADQLSRALVGQFKDGGYEGLHLNYIDGFTQLNELSGIAQDVFMDWFYESLGAHYEEFSFFAKNTDKQWFQRVQERFSAWSTSTQTCKNGTISQTWILENGAPFAVYKSLYSNRKIPGIGNMNRDVKRECLSSIFAKVMGLDDVVNGVIPVRVSGNQLVFDPLNYTGAVERFVGFSAGQIPPFTSFGNLVTQICNTSKNDNTLEGGSMNNKNLNGTTYHVLHQHNIDKDLGIGIFSSAQKNILASSQTISLESLFKVIVFWYLSDYKDMHVGNIVFLPDFATSKFKPIVIDNECTWGRDEMAKLYPFVYNLAQAKNGAASSMFNQLRNDRNKLGNMFKNFSSLKIQKDSFFVRLDNLTRICYQSRSIGNLMNAIVHPNRQSSDEFDNPVVAAYQQKVANQNRYNNPFAHYQPANQNRYNDPFAHYQPANNNGYSDPFARCQKQSAYIDDLWKQMEADMQRSMDQMDAHFAQFNGRWK